MSLFLLNLQVCARRTSSHRLAYNFLRERRNLLRYMLSDFVLNPRSKKPGTGLSWGEVSFDQVLPIN